MADPNSARDSRLLLIRIRARESSTGTGATCCLEAEAILDYESIFPATRFQLDTAQLQASFMNPNNQYGQLLGVQLSSAAGIQQALAAVGQPETLRVQLMLEGDGPHETVRWERLALPIRPGEPLALRRDTPFSRFAAVDLPQENAPEDARFHLLVAIAGPDADEITRFDIAPIDAVVECSAILDACKDLLESGQMEVTLLPGKAGLPAGFHPYANLANVHIFDGFSTAERIAELLEGLHGLHVIAHGRQGKQFNLILEDESLGMLARTHDQLIELWQPQRLRLIFLQSCQSAAVRPVNDPRPHIAGFMQELVRAGAPAVVAMQDFVRMSDAREFNRGFYTSLIREGLVDEAANNGRRQLSESVDMAWSIPAVTTRLKGGSVWRESPLRAAQKKLRDRLHLERTRGYPLFPVDVAAVTSADLLKRSTNPSRDDIESVYPAGEGLRVDAYRSLCESVAQPRPGHTVCVIGAHGRGKSTMLEALYLNEIDRHWRGEQPAIPVMLRLADCAHTSFDAERTFASAIAKYFEVQAGAKIDPFYLLNCFDQQQFLFLLSGDEDLGDAVLQQATNTFRAFRNARRSPDTHQYVIILDQATIKVGDVPDASTCLIIQPMSVERVSTYLRSLPSEDRPRQLGSRLLERLSEGLWDLAEVPWLLREMLDQADRGVLGNTRADILRRVVDGRIAQITGPVGMRARVEDVLTRLAWELYSGRMTSLPGTDLFNLLMSLRGNRDYSLVDFRTQLINPCRMMAAGDEDGLRFAYPGFRSYCCALYLHRQPLDVRDRLLEEITATLGRRSRAQLWEEVLLILAGLWNDTGSLLRMILSGVALSEGDHLYIAARCLQEARQAFATGSSDDPMVRSVVSALIYRSHPRSLRSVSTRKKAIQFLGPLKEAKGIPHLVSLALKKIRPEAGHNRMTYDFSGIRLAAIKALLYTPDAVLEYVRRDKTWSGDAALHETLEGWLQYDCARLCTRLDDVGNVPVASVAAFALAVTKLTGAQAALEKRFLAPDNSEDLLWAVTDALLELSDPVLGAFVAAHMDREDRQPQIAYLIGKLGSARVDSSEYRFLHQHLASGDFALRGRCLQALAELRDTTILGTCHKWLNDRNFVFRYYSLQSLRHVGTEQTLALLTQAQWSGENDAATSASLAIERLRLEVYEDIYWRLAGGRSREVMAPIPQSA
jgi:hypothetical protein